MVSVKHNFFLIGVFQWFDSWQRKGIFFLSGNGINTNSQSIQVPSKHVHEDCFCDIIGIVACDYFGASKFDCSSFECLSSKNSTISAIIGLPNGLNNFIHSPPIEFLVGQYFKRESFNFLVPLDCFQGIISIALYPLVNGKHEELDPIIVFLVEFVKHMTEYCRILASTCTDCQFFPWLEELILDDGLVDLGFEADEKAFLANGLLGFRAFNFGLGIVAHFALHFGHLVDISFIEQQIIKHVNLI